jgi:hypothetical protein
MAGRSVWPNYRAQVDIDHRRRSDRQVIIPALLRQVCDVEARIEPYSKGLPHLIVEGRTAAS